MSHCVRPSTLACSIFGLVVPRASFKLAHLPKCRSKRDAQRDAQRGAQRGAQRDAQRGKASVKATSIEAADKRAIA